MGKWLKKAKNLLVIEIAKLKKIFKEPEGSQIYLQCVHNLYNVIMKPCTMQKMTSFEKILMIFAYKKFFYFSIFVPRRIDLL